MVFCAICGNEVSEILKFCPSCGASTSKDESDLEIESNNRQLVDDQDHKQARKERYQDLRNRVERYKKVSRAFLKRVYPGLRMKPGCILSSM
jgi:uncharacterized membrane protein YvbJ